MTTAYDFSARDIDGKDVSLSSWKGKAMLIVNVASKCGFTPQYAGLEALHRKYQDKGFAVLGFPHQVPGRPRWAGRQALCADGYAGSHRQGTRQDVGLVKSWE